MQRSGYSDKQTDPETLGTLQELHVLDTTISRELANHLSGLTGQGNARFNEIKVVRDYLVSGIRGKRVERLGATRSYNKGANVPATGISIRAKRWVEDDSGRLKGNAGRGISDYSGAVSPTARPR